MFDSIKEDIFHQLPFNYQYLTKIPRKAQNQNLSDIRLRNSSINISDYNTNTFLPYHHYKPISKIIVLDALKDE
jgi:hypothetical protein